MRVLFAGTPEIALPSLLKLNEDHDVVGVLTNPDKCCGRGQEIACCPVKLEADDLGIKVLQPEKLDEAFIEEVKLLKPDILAVVAFGKIFKKNFLDIFPEGALNVHPSLLPKFRGASPIPSALLNGDSETGITIQRLALKMDSGNILKQEPYVYKGDETCETLTTYFAHRGAELLSETITQIENGDIAERIQDEAEATYCSYINKKDGLINWNDSAEYIERKLRAFTPWPGIYTFYGKKKLNIIDAGIFPETGITQSNSCENGKVIGIDKNNGILIQTGKGILAVKRLQLQSKKALNWKDFLNGVKDFNETVLGGE
ncbi:MAG: methionyl-tRNA formyltransferase [Spirochaetales bacterium]|nr:methionyl-tRNA formyltransferase [Spirochaetales bacterium]